MLVLTRKAGEKVDIGDDIQVVILQLMGNKVRIGIQAPDDVTIMRTELQKRDKDKK